MKGRPIILDSTDLQDYPTVKKAAKKLDIQDAFPVSIIQAKATAS